MNGFHVAGNPKAEYRAISQWTGQGWHARIEDHDEVHRGDTTALRLHQVSDRAGRFLSRLLGCQPAVVEVAVEACLPVELEGALSAAEALVAQAATHVEAVVARLRQENMPGYDIAALLAARALLAGPPRPLLIPNNEIASFGLTHRPDVLAIETVSGNLAETFCRCCVNHHRHDLGLPPSGASAAIHHRPPPCDAWDHDAVLAKLGQAGP